MKAVAVFKNNDTPEEIDIDEPVISRPEEIKVKILKAGIDGTDRAILEYGLSDPPEGEDFLVLGHEAFGKVIEVGDGVKDIKAGDYVIPTVRRGCNRCASCLHGQSDMCFTGLYKERGIHKLHGYFTEYIVEEEDYLVKVPPELKDLAVLTEPLSIAEKALKDVRFIQSRLPWACSHPEHRYDSEEWGGCKKAIVIGIGPLGFLAACLLRYYDLPVYALVNRDESDIRVKLIGEIGAEYIDSREITFEEAVKKTGNADLVFEASGNAALALDLLPILSRNGVCVLTGIPRGKKKVCFDANLVLRQTVKNNQIILGSINSNRTHFELAIKHLTELKKMFGEAIKGLITKKYSLKDYERALGKREKEGLKTVFIMDEGNEGL